MWRISALDRDGREVGHSELVVGELTIGRDADRQLILPSASVSRTPRARLSSTAGSPASSTRASANGVIVDGVRITQPTYRRAGHAHRRGRVPHRAGDARARRRAAGTAAHDAGAGGSLPSPGAADAPGRRGRPLRRPRLRAAGGRDHRRARRRQRRGARRSVAVAQARAHPSRAARASWRSRISALQRHLRQRAQDRPRLGRAGRHRALRRAGVSRRGRQQLPARSAVPAELPRQQFVLLAGGAASPSCCWSS